MKSCTSRRRDGATKAEGNAGGGEKGNDDEDKTENADKREKEDAGKEEMEASGEQAVRVSKQQEENATREEGDDARDPEGNAAVKIDRRAEGRKNEADEEGAGGTPRSTSPTEEQRASKKQNLATSQEGSGYLSSISEDGNVGIALECGRVGDREFATIQDVGGFGGVKVVGPGSIGTVEDQEKNAIWWACNRFPEEARPKKQLTRWRAYCTTLEYMRGREGWGKARGLRELLQLCSARGELQQLWKAPEST
ncbi:hypothetical protein NDU88_005717 [Pleurodeles waltl]|uniref:Uncharacterized protein n=1 Tax=Pleurodeles waltl TaxID=8319 RepID=A0AAV7PJB8_PLEWA|nr:hypothetical protein NDU88_005717 [Pleurodeles waltl]